MSRFDDKLAELVAAGALSEDEANDLAAASPLKAERDAAKAQSEADRARVAQLEGKQAAEIFTKLGLPGTPDTYALPEGVDRTDEAQIQAWATQVGLLKVTEPEPTAEALAHQRMDNAGQSSGGAPPPPNMGGQIDQLRKQIMRAGPDQLAMGSDLYNKTIDTLRAAGHNFDTVEHSSTFERIPEWGSKTPA